MLRVLGEKEPELLIPPSNEPPMLRLPEPNEREPLCGLVSNEPLLLRVLGEYEPLLLREPEPNVPVLRDVEPNEDSDDERGEVERLGENVLLGGDTYPLDRLPLLLEPKRL